MDIRARRAAENEVRARDINETIERVLGGDGVCAFRCECSREECEQWVKLGSPAYERLRDGARRFVVVADHVDARIEWVVEAHYRYTVVEKYGEAGEIAEQADPRPDT